MAGKAFGKRVTGGATALAGAAALLLTGCSTLLPQTPQPAQPPASARPSDPEAPALSARAAAAQGSLKTMVALQDRLSRVSAPLLINNADLCRTQARNLLGFTAQNRYSYPGEYNEASVAVLGYGERLQVSSVLAGSGAARAGLRKGDNLMAVEGKQLPGGPEAEVQAAEVLGPLVGSRAALDVTIARTGNNQTLKVPVTRACAIRVNLGNSDNINSYADGSRVLITRGMINFAQSDEAIAFVMAKDIAHNVLGHPGAMRNSATVGSMIDNLVRAKPDLSLLIGGAGIKAVPADMDAAADSLALYMLARAGYNIDHAKPFWQRLASQYPATVLNGYTAVHPGTAQRMAAIDRTVAEIKAKLAAKKPLLP
ncbi:M48 family metallopeptidase [Pseudoduganella namucuonensis]|uniref:Peptidase family M48 n=1 Tax=Pseudoduganella namucuonensis TaxID=1035707 RepID=A0A1I7LQW6_9BURK|nr:M48 family metallopeptidase [Pseudoduganella namucuonensis]SFV12058.1 Peptidase family M48 [Pseudoduganella namucuonensis]